MTFFLMGQFTGRYGSSGPSKSTNTSAPVGLSPSGCENLGVFAFARHRERRMRARAELLELVRTRFSDSGVEGYCGPGARRGLAGRTRSCGGSGGLRDAFRGRLGGGHRCGGLLRLWLRSRRLRGSSLRRRRWRQRRMMFGRFGGQTLLLDPLLVSVRDVRFASLCRFPGRVNKTSVNYSVKLACMLARSFSTTLTTAEIYMHG